MGNTLSEDVKKTKERISKKNDAVQTECNHLIAIAQHLKFESAQMSTRFDKIVVCDDTDRLKFREIYAKYNNKLNEIMTSLTIATYFTIWLNHRPRNHLPRKKTQRWKIRDLLFNTARRTQPYQLL